MVFRATLCFFALCTLASCSSRTLTPDQTKYLTTAKDHPTQFIMLRAEEQAAWGRAILWIRSYSNMDLAMVNDSLIATDPPGKGRDWELSSGYSVHKKHKGDRVEISV